MLLATGGGTAWAARYYGNRGPAASARLSAVPATPVRVREEAAPPPTPWRTSWALSLAHSGVIKGTDLTCRLVARASLSGSRVRFRLINYPATKPVTFSHLVAAVRTTGMNVDPATQRPVTVHGLSGVTLPPNGQVYTDPINLSIQRGQDVTLSIAVSAGTSAPWHFWTAQSSYCTPPNSGDTATDPSAAGFTDRIEDAWLSEVQVIPAQQVPTVAVYGDSLSDGLYLPIDTGSRWTDQLENQVNGRLVALNLGVSGDQITGRAPTGQLPSRVASDVFAPAGVSAVIVQMGSNDIKAGATAEQILAQYQLIAAEVAKRGETLIVATVPARNDDISPEQEYQRELLNAGLRGYPIVADLDAALTDATTNRFRADYNMGDTIHPNLAGVAVITSVMRAAIARVPGPLGLAAR